MSGPTGVVAGFFDASSLAVRRCRAARAKDLGGAEVFGLNVTDREVKRCNRGGMVGSVCDVLKRVSQDALESHGFLVKLKDRRKIRVSRNTSRGITLLSSNA